MIKNYKRNILSTGVGTLALAALMVFANSAITHKAFAYSAEEITAEKESAAVTSIDEPAKSPTIEISTISDTSYMAAKRTPEDIAKEQAVGIAAKAIQEKFGISLDGTYATPIFCTLEKTPGNYYFVSFADKDDMKAAEATSTKDNGQMFDVYIAFINAKTGEVVSAEKNPEATGDVSHG